MTETGHPLHPLQPVRELPRPRHGQGVARLRVARSSTRRPAGWPRSARWASCGSAGVRGISVFLEYFDNPEANEKMFTDGRLVPHRRHRAPRGRRQHLLLRPRQGRAQGRRRERVGPRGRGRVPDRAAASRTSRWSPRRTRCSTWCRLPSSSQRVRGARGRDGPRRSSTRCAANLADFKVPRAVYFVDEFPTAELGKISKKDLRETADGFAPV